MHKNYLHSPRYGADNAICKADAACCFAKCWPQKSARVFIPWLKLSRLPSIIPRLIYDVCQHLPWHETQCCLWMDGEWRRSKEVEDYCQISSRGEIERDTADADIMSTELLKHF